LGFRVSWPLPTSISAIISSFAPVGSGIRGLSNRQGLEETSGLVVDTPFHSLKTVRPFSASTLWLGLVIARSIWLEHSVRVLFSNVLLEIAYGLSRSKGSGVELLLA
jgi:hypothetical protein